MARRPRGFGHIYRPRKRLSDGTVKELGVWRIAYYAHGKLIRESTGTGVKTEAEKVLRQRTLTKDQGVSVEPVVQRTTLDDLARLVETDYRNNGRASIREVSRAFARLPLLDHFYPASEEVRALAVGIAFARGSEPHAQ